MARGLVYRFCFNLVAFCILSPLVLNVAQSINYELIGNWVEVSNFSEKYNDWKTYTMKGPQIGQIKALEAGKFIFAWKMDKLGEKNKLYFKREIFSNKDKFEKTNYYNVEKDEVLKFTFSIADTNGGQLWIAFPQAEQEDSPPDIPKIIQGSNRGDNETYYNLSLESSDRDGDRIQFVVDWDDGNNSTASGENGSLNHKWKDGGVYDIKINAIDEHGLKSVTNHKKIKIFSLVRVSAKMPLQPLINGCSPYTNIILEGDVYEGPIEIINKNNISIQSSGICNITSINETNSAIGLQNSRDILIEGLNIEGYANEIYLLNCTNCNVAKNKIFSKKCAITVSYGHDNSIINNIIERNVSYRCDDAYIGIRIDNSFDDSLICNIINGLTDSDALYNIINSTFKEIRLNKSTDGIIISDACCRHVMNGRIGSPRPCPEYFVSEQRIDCESLPHIGFCL